MTLSIAASVPRDGSVSLRWETDTRAETGAPEADPVTHAATDVRMTAEVALAKTETATAAGEIVATGVPAKTSAIETNTVPGADTAAEDNAAMVLAVTAVATGDIAAAAPAEMAAGTADTAAVVPAAKALAMADTAANRAVTSTAHPRADATAEAGARAIEADAIPHHVTPTDRPRTAAISAEEIATATPDDRGNVIAGANREILATPSSEVASPEVGITEIETPEVEMSSAVGVISAAETTANTDLENVSTDLEIANTDLENVSTDLETADTNPEIAKPVLISSTDPAISSTGLAIGTKRATGATEGGSNVVVARTVMSTATGVTTAIVMIPVITVINAPATDAISAIDATAAPTNGASNHEARAEHRPPGASRDATSVAAIRDPAARTSHKPPAIRSFASHKTAPICHRARRPFTSSCCGTTASGFRWRISFTSTSPTPTSSDPIAVSSRSSATARFDIETL